MAKRRKRNPAKRQRALATVERMERLQRNMEDIVDEVCAELIRAVGRYPTFASGHEGWAVMREEMDELWDERLMHHDSKRHCVDPSGDRSHSHAGPAPREKLPGLCVGQRRPLRAPDGVAGAGVVRDPGGDVAVSVAGAGE